jgi:hypothetical protein
MVLHGTLLLTSICVTSSLFGPLVIPVLASFSLSLVISSLMSLMILVFSIYKLQSQVFLFLNINIKGLPNWI